MADTQDDIICRLLSQLRTLNEILDSTATLEPDQLKALRLLRLSLMSSMSSCEAPLKQMRELISTIASRFSFELALFSAKGQFLGHSQALEELLETKPGETLFSNNSKKIKFLNANKDLLDIHSLPWKLAPGLDEQFEPRLLLHNEKSKKYKWLACLVTELAPGQEAGNPGEPARAACFMNLDELVQLEQRLASACQLLQGETRDLSAAQNEIERLKERIKRGSERLELEAFAPRTHERPRREEQAQEGQARKVLVVDDIAINQKLLAKRLQKLNLESEFASNGKQGVEMALEGNYALIFMDCEMPVMDGFEATALIRKSEIESGGHVPIIALTSYDREDDRERCLSAGMDEYLSKGASPNLLQEVVEWCLRRSSPVLEETLNLDDYEEDLDLKGLAETFTKEELNELFDLFVPSTNTLMRCLRMSMDERDLRSIGHFAYSLKGPFASLGMLRTSKLTARLTDAAEDSQWEEADDYYEMLRRNCETLRTQLEERAARQN